MRSYTINIMMKQAVLLITLLALAACSSISVRSDWDSGVDFSQFETFIVLENEEPSINQLVDQRIRAAIIADLTSKGLRQVDTADKAGLSFGFQVTTEQRTSYQTVHSGWSNHGYRSSGTHWGGSVGTSRTTQFNFTVGTLIIAAFQSDNKELVWEGTGTDTVNPSSGPEQSTQNINNAVQQILSDFPPK